MRKYSNEYLEPLPARFTMFPEQRKTDFGCAVDFWVDAYRSGVRIALTEDGWAYQSVIGNMTRIHQSGHYGYFGLLEAIEPAPWIESSVEIFGDLLRVLYRSAGAPGEIKRLLGHILVLDGEFDEAAVYAASQGGRLDAILVEGGRIPLWTYTGEVREVKHRRRAMAGISLIQFYQ